MIGKGAQYLTAAGFGRYRITAASLGSLDLLSWLRWLKGSAIQAIMDAFGVDGKAVIAATNEYLNGIAASDKAKATALAGFINEDPMMVCSLGLEPQGVTMPVRWLVGDGTAYITTQIIPSTNTLFKMYCKFPDTSGNYRNGVINGPSTPIRYYFGSMSGSFCMGYGTNQFAHSLVRADTNPHLFVLGQRKLVIDGTVYSPSNITTDPVLIAPVGIFYVNNPFDGNTFNAKESVGYCIFETNGVVQGHFIPCKHNGQCGLYDIEGMTWYGNANTSGSFTIPDISYTPTP